MYDIPQYQPEIRLIGTDGEVYHYKNYQEFIENVNYYFVERHVINTMKEHHSWLDALIYRRLGKNDECPTKYIIRDQFGSMFSKNEVLNDIREYNKSTRNKNSYIRKYNERYRHVIFRYTPVPFTGKKSWRFGSFYKKPKTTQERRWSYAHREYVRGKRRDHMLPNVWDDRLRGDVDNRKCWKSQKKKKQWM